MEIIEQVCDVLFKLPAVVLLLMLIIYAISGLISIYNSIDVGKYSYIHLRDAKEVQQEIWEETTKETKERLKAENAGEFDSVVG